jgi:hypothetical protein
MAYLERDGAGASPRRGVIARIDQIHAEAMDPVRGSKSVIVSVPEPGGGVEVLLALTIPAPASGSRARGFHTLRDA